jgi:RHS repeat-associated protein
VTYYVYDGGLLLGTVCGSGTVTSAYTWGPTGPISERLTQQNRSRWYYYGPQGETRLLADPTGAVVDSYTYTGYGQPIGASGPDSNPFRFGGGFGYQTDPNTGLILCTARWYDPASTRWLSRDPIGYSGGFNLYCYVQDNPLATADPSGLCGPTEDPVVQIMHAIPGGSLGADGAQVIDGYMNGNAGATGRFQLGRLRDYSVHRRRARRPDRWWRLFRLRLNGRVRLGNRRFLG